MNTKNRKFACPRVLVIGGGLMGLWPAALLAQRGCAVTVLEAGKKSIGASWAAAGMLAPASEAGERLEPAAVLDAFAVHNFGLWKDWAARFEDAGHDICWRPFGGLLSAFDEAGLQRLERTSTAASVLDLKAARLNAVAMIAREPALCRKVLAGLLITEEASVDPRLVLTALKALLDNAGGAVRYNQQVVGIEQHNGILRVVCANGQAFEADRIIVAAGFWAGKIEGVGELKAALRPVKGQMLALEAPDNPVRCVIREVRAYIVPRGNGQIVIGATSEPGLEDVDTHTIDIARLHAGAAKIIPVLARCQRLGSWAGVRPQSIDEQPMIGPLSLPGVIATCGHHRNGVLLAPASADMVCAMIMDEEPGVYADAFLPGRFLPC